MADASRVFDGFKTLQGGMDGGRAADLIQPNQLAAAVNASLRGSYLKSRPPFESSPFTFESEATQARFTGRFQGAMFYDSPSGHSVHIISLGGRLFRISTDGNNLVGEITPQLIITVTADFTVPAPGGIVAVNVSSETVISVGQTVHIDSGIYGVTNRFTNGLFLQYISSAANATVVAGTAVLTDQDEPIIEFQENPASLELVYMFQAEIYAIILGGQHKTIIFDGLTSRQAGVKEVPPGLLGIYVWGRIWITLTDQRSFVAGDLVRGPSGTPANGFIDAILKFTENDFLNEGGTFGVPVNAGPITAMIELATQDTSLGQGNLLVMTLNSVFSVNTPVDRTTWKNLTYPIQTVALIGYGATGPRFACSINGDAWMRTQDGFRSFMVSRRDFGTWGNTPMSREIVPIIDFDSANLLYFGSCIFFDNRFIATVSPYETENGFLHKGLVALNFDLISSLAGKTNPAWEGAWSGLEVFQLTKGTTNGVERGFAWVQNGDCLQLWEIKKTGYFDAISDGSSITRTSIQGWAETRAMDFSTPEQLKSLRMAELAVDEIVDLVIIRIKFRPDQYPQWLDWATIQLCATVSQCNITAPTGSECSVWKPGTKLYAARIRIPAPPESCNTITEELIKDGHEFQFRIEWTGSVRFRKFAAHCNVKTQPMEGACPPTQECDKFEDCGTEWFTYRSAPICTS